MSSENRRRRRPVIDAEQVLIRANEVFIIEDDVHRQRFEDFEDDLVAGVFDEEDLIPRRRRHRRR